MTHLSRSLLRLAGAALLLAGAGPELHAQELTVLYGTARTGGLAHSSFSYEVDYRQDFYRNLAASASYINEGHLPGHHRDGTAFEAWGKLPTPHEHFSVSLGIGAYYFYDTEERPDGGSANTHGAAPIFSVAGTGYLGNRWFYRAMIHHIQPAGRMTVNTAVLGVGYWFGREEKPTQGGLGDTPSERAYTSGDEVTVFAGQSVVNTFFSAKARAYAAEYRHGLDRHIDLTTSLIYEGNPQIVRRSGLTLQGWAVNAFFDDQVTLGIGFGPYVYIDSKNPPAPATGTAARVAGMGSLSLAERLSEHWMARLMFNRVTSSYNLDADIFLLGLGYRWSR
jgi:hypothetical protein